MFISECTGRLGACGEGEREAAGHVWREIESANSWQSTSLFVGRSVQWTNQTAVRWRGVHRARNEAPNGNAERRPAAVLPLDRLLIKELACSDFILSWKVSKRPLVMPLIPLPAAIFEDITRECGDLSTPLKLHSLSSLTRISSEPGWRGKQLPGNS